MTNRILIVDDSRVARTMTKRLLSEIDPNADIQEASTGDEAVAIASSAPFRAIFMDMNMPGIDGLTAAGRILAKLPGQKLALVTANIQDAVRDRAKTMGVAFIGKPIQRADVEAFLKS